MQATHQNHGWRVRSKRQFGRHGRSLGVAAGQHRHQFVVHNFDDLLTGRNAAQYVRADSLLADLLNEFTHDGQCNVGFKQSQTDFPHRIPDIAFRQRALSG